MKKNTWKYKDKFNMEFFFTSGSYNEFKEGDILWTKQK